MTETPAVSLEFKRQSDTEITSEQIKSAEDLGKLLETHGVWAETKEESNGKGTLKWDESLLAKLYGEFEAGERRFYLSLLKNELGETKSRFETEIKTVLADIRHTTRSGKNLQMVQYIDYYVATMDEYTRRITSENFMKGFTQKSDSSMSGKLNFKVDGEDWIKALYREMSEELKLRKSSYEIIKEGQVEYTEGVSRGYPGLWTRQEFKKYDIQLNKGYRKQYIDLGKPQKFGGGWKRPINVHKWREIKTT